MRREVVLAITILSMTTAGLAQKSAPKPAGKTKVPTLATTASAKPVSAAQPMSVPSTDRNAKPVADEIDTWVKPLYRSTKGQEKTITQVEKFPFRESTYLSAQPIEVLPKDQYRYVTPEDALVSRLSAMANLDYEGWLKSWDEKSQAFLKQLDARPEFGAQKRVSQWRGVFSQVKPVLVRRVETGTYVIVTYRLVNKQGKDAGILEFPAVMRQVGGLWLGVEDLSSDPLLNLSPWVSGRSAEEAAARPLSQAVIK